MSRFGHLEFEESHKPRKDMQDVPLQTGSPILTAGSLLLKAHEEYRWGRHEMALRLYTRCLEEDRSSIAARVGQVQMLVQLGEYPEARLWADKSLELFRNNGDLLAAKAQACIRGGDKKAAYACSDISMQQPGCSPYSWQSRGEVLLACRQNAYDACFKRSLTEPASDWFARVVIANIFLYYHKAAAALEYASQAVELMPRAGYAWFVLGYCQYQLGLDVAAVASIQRCLEYQPDYSPAKEALRQFESQSFFQRLMRRLGRG